MDAETDLLVSHTQYVKEVVCSWIRSQYDYDCFYKGVKSYW